MGPKAKRHRFSAIIKLRILNEAEGCTQPGNIGVLLSRKGRYKLHLAQCHRQRDQGMLYGSTLAGRELLAYEGIVKDIL